MPYTRNACSTAMGVKNPAPITKLEIVALAFHYDG